MKRLLATHLAGLELPAGRTPPGRRRRATSASVASGSIQWKACTAVTTSADRPVPQPRPTTSRGRTTRA